MPFAAFWRSVRRVSVSVLVTMLCLANGNASAFLVRALRLSYRRLARRPDRRAHDQREKNNATHDERQVYTMAANDDDGLPPSMQVQAASFFFVLPLAFAG